MRRSSNLDAQRKRYSHLEAGVAVYDQLTAGSLLGDLELPFGDNVQELEGLPLSSDNYSGRYRSFEVSTSVPIFTYWSKLKVLD